MKTKVEQLIEAAENYFNNGELALQEIQRSLKFRGFTHEIPLINICSSGEIILCWNGKELNKFQILEIHNSKGYFTPEDF